MTSMERIEIFRNCIWWSFGIVFLYLMIFSCKDQNKEMKQSIQSFNYVATDDTIINKNPYLTKNYLNERQRWEDYRYYIIDTLFIDDAVLLSYKDAEIQIDMITSKDIVNNIEFDQITPWQLLSRKDIYLQGIGGRNHRFLSDIETRELPEPVMEIMSFKRYSINYVASPLLQRKFLFVIIDEATYMLTEAVEGLNAPITAHTVGLPFKMLYPLEED